MTGFVTPEERVGSQYYYCFDQHCFQQTLHPPGVKPTRHTGISCQLFALYSCCKRAMTKIHLVLLLSILFKVSNHTSYGSASVSSTFSPFVYCLNGPALNRSSRSTQNPVLCCKQRSHPGRFSELYYVDYYTWLHNAHR